MINAVAVKEMEAVVGEDVFNPEVNADPALGELNMDVKRLVREVPMYKMSGPIREVAEQLRKFEDGFCFVPVQMPQVAGDYYLANTYEAADPTVLPEYTQASDHYRLLKSNETLSAIADAMGDHIHVEAVIQKSISASLFDPNVSMEEPIVFYLNSYNRSTREKIILGFALLGFNYLHRRSGEQRDDFNNVMEYFADVPYEKGTALLRDYPVSFREFRGLAKKVALPLKRLAYHMFGVSREDWQLHEKDDSTMDFVYDLFVKRYVYGPASRGNKGAQSMMNGVPNLLNLIAFMHDVYHFHTEHERFDVATRMLDNASDYMTKKLLPAAKFSELI